MCLQVPHVPRFYPADHPNRPTLNIFTTSDSSSSPSLFWDLLEFINLCVFFPLPLSFPGCASVFKDVSIVRDWLAEVSLKIPVLLGEALAPSPCLPLRKLPSPSLFFFPQIQLRSQTHTAPFPSLPLSPRCTFCREHIRRVRGKLFKLGAELLGLSKNTRIACESPPPLLPPPLDGALSVSTPLAPSTTSPEE